MSFKSTEKDLLDHADSQGGFSEYVKRLIRNDVNNAQSSLTLEQIEFIKTLLLPPQNNNVKQDNNIKVADKNKALNLLESLKINK